MNGTARLAVSCAIAVLAAAPAFAQASIQPAPQPVVTAERAPWYISGEPVMYEGNIYYPAGPQIHFNPNEMVRSGSYQGIPLYIRTTIEPYSIVFVPLPGGLMQPYERRRAGDVAGSIGSSVPSFPISLSSQPGRDLGAVAQAAGPPVQAAPAIESPVTPAAVTLPVPASPVQAAPSQPQEPQVGTSGLAMPQPPPGGPEARRRAQDGIFIRFENQRWFNSGAATPLDTTRLTRIGEYHGLPVYAQRGGPSSTIYIPVALSVPDVVTPYSNRR